MCLLKTGACLIQVHFNVSAFFGKRLHACLTHIACLIEMATKTGFIVSIITILTVGWLGGVERGGVGRG